MYLSRLTIKRDPSVAALDALLDPAHAGARGDAHHRLLWSAFSGDPGAERDFLWRAEAKGRFIALSARRPTGGALFEPPEIKDFAPDLHPGDRLSFALRANATRQRKDVGRVDVVMDALYPLREGRAEARMAAAQTAATAWMEGQGAQHGFTLHALAVDDYSVMAIPGHRGRRKGQPQFGILDMVGQLEVTDPAAFVKKLAAGFGRAKAFGCGLMLVRRV